MKIMEKEFTKWQFNFKQVKRDGDIAIYEKSKPESKISYEVVRIGRHNGYTLAGTFIAPAETLPSDSQWGIHGFTCVTLEEAQAKFRKMLSENIKNEQNSKDGIAKKRGRKSLDTVELTIPAGKFTLKDLEKTNSKIDKNVFDATVRKLMKENKLKKVGVLANYKGHGRTPCMFIKL